ncbi:hypothetical protein O3M35_007300 [Rhynocoris fuscipes]|uniref:Uncharacterized protein n=1 Tax=Rhynocoris fuscipes TaxID=488301 RepID=A0AAW1DEN2_9HEMI
MYSPDVLDSSEILIGRSDCRAIVRVQRGWSEESGYSSTPPANMTPHDDSSSSVLEYLDLDSLAEETRPTAVGQSGCCTDSLRRQSSLDDYFQSPTSAVPTPVDTPLSCTPSVSSVSSVNMQDYQTQLEEENEDQEEEEEEDDRVMVPAEGLNCGVYRL